MAETTAKAPDGNKSDTTAFEGIEDAYNCINLDVTPEYFDQMDLSVFKVELEMSVKKWSTEGRRGIWLKIDSSVSQFIPIAVELGFTFHHTKPDYLMLTKWLASNEQNNLPHYAGFYIGAGGLVVNDKNEILTIQERYTLLNKSRWKLPGGLVDPNEPIVEAAIREVQEETGVKTEFVSLLSIRQMSHYRFGCSDLYFVCLLRPLSDKLSPDHQEVKECKWMDIQEFLSQDLVPVNRMIVEDYLKGVLLPVQVGVTQIPHYRKGLPSMQFYTLQEKLHQLPKSNI